MSVATEDTNAVVIERDAPLSTWFGIGGRADRLARPRSIEDLLRCVRLDPALRVLGDGANLLVHDEGVSELVVCLSDPRWERTEIDQRTGRVVAGAGVSLPRLIKATIEAGLSGLEGLGGIPATVGGAVIMNAGGRFGQIGDAVQSVHAVDRAGIEVVRDRREIRFEYRRSGLHELILTSVEFMLSPSDPAALRQRHKEVMEYKTGSQPLSADSAGCVFKNPLLASDLEGIGARGERVSAGRLIDLAGCKGLSVGGASVSERHGNFIVTSRGCLAADVLELMERVRARVADRFGVMIEPEIVVWRRDR